MKSSIVFLLSLLMSLTAVAAPLVKVPPLSPIGQANIKDPAKQVPPASAVPYPAYPGSYYLFKEWYKAPAPGMEVLTLASEDPPAKVRAWYAKRFKVVRHMQARYAYAKKGHPKSFWGLAAGPCVQIWPLSPDDAEMMQFDLPKVKTKIMLSFKRKTKM